MTPAAKLGVVRAFGAANNYHSHARIQRHVAQELATMVAQRTFLTKPAILEIGCGTGFLSQHLLQHWPTSELLLSDISWPMVKRCRANLGNPATTIRYVVLDGEHPPLAAHFELIIASMAFQWFTNPLATLAVLGPLLRPGGCLAFATLGQHTFQEWQTACTALKMASGVALYPTAAAWKQGWQHGTTWIQEKQQTVNYPSGLAFLRELKAIGAHLPHDGYRVQSAGLLRRLLRYLDQNNGFAITYHLLYGIFTREEQVDKEKNSGETHGRNDRLF